MKKGFTQAILVAGAISVAAAFAPTAAKAADILCSTAKLIVPWGAGGGTDVLFRIFAETANKQGANPQIQVVNMGGQGGNKGAKEARKAKADGCTLFAIHQSAITSNLTGRVDFTWDAFEPVAMLTRTPLIVGANPDVPYNNTTEMVANAKSRPGELLTGGTLGSTSHFFFLLIEDATGTKLKHISYDGTRQRMTALLAKTIEIGEINLASAKKYIQTNELKALGISTKARHPDIPDVATLQEQGIDIVYGTDRGIMLPKGTPKAIVQHYIDVLGKVANDPAYRKSIENKGSSVEYIYGDAYTKYFDDTFTKWKAIAKKVGVYKGK
ncbi:MAG: tripartite tricarboxylate transporter substrate binding protein [Alphaproteobacteria bacterium]|nr:tripartite tricarboxylate transporter substrate binding protein [Alphaproteobacteria bacterium]